MVPQVGLLSYGKNQLKIRNYPCIFDMLNYLNGKYNLRS